MIEGYADPEVKYDITYLSLGAGVQSTALMAMSCDDDRVPTADLAIFADTQCEPDYVYKNIERLKTLSDIPIHVVTAGSLTEDAIDRHNGQRSRFAAIPVWTLGADNRSVPLRRQCTREYKIDPIEKFVRGALGYQPRQRIKKRARCLIGISKDEVRRMKPSRTRWIDNAFPLIDIGMTRGGCIEYLKTRGWDAPNRSACIVCPYHSDDYWKRLKERHPDEFRRAVAFDKAVRDMSASGVRNPVYLHQSLKPLGDIDFTHGGQRDFFDEECEGMCGQ